MTTNEKAPAAPTCQPQPPDAGGWMDGRFDGQAGVWEPRLPDDQAYMDAYQQAHAEATAVRQRANARSNFSAGFGAAQAGEDYQAALERAGLAAQRQPN